MYYNESFQVAAEPKHIFKFHTNITANIVISLPSSKYSTSVSSQSHSTYSTSVLLWDSRYSEPGVSQVLHCLNYKVLFSMPPRPP